MLYSAKAREFVARWGDAPDAVNEWGENLVLRLVAHGRGGADYLCLESALRHGYAPDCDSPYSLGALHEAVDCERWAVAELLLRYPINREHLLRATACALGLTESRCSRRAHYYLQLLLQRLGGLSRTECRRLLLAAFSHGAVAYMLPLMLTGATLPPPEEWETPPEYISCHYCYTDDFSPTANLYRCFFCERLLQLFALHAHRFASFAVRGGLLFFTGNPAEALTHPRYRYRRPSPHGVRMKHLIHRALLLLAPTFISRNSGV